jgi:RND family efflux transporter MFP subunit
MNSMTGKSLLGAILCLSLILFISACTQSETEEKKPIEDKAVPVKVLDIETQDLPLIVESVGRLTANREVTLAAEVGGVVKEYKADVGDRVETSQLLVRIDPRDYQLALREAKANLAAGRARLDASSKTFERSKALLPQKVISSDAFDKNEAEYKTAKATLAQIKAMVDVAIENVNKTRITAPFEGLVAKRLIEKGQTVGVGTPVMTLVDLDTVRVAIHMAECDYVCVDPDDPVLVTVEAFPEKSFKGRIDRIGVKGDERTNTFDVEILLDNPGLTLKAGLSARVRITTDVIPDTILIPQSTVLYREDRREVFVVGQGLLAELRTVKLGRTRGSLVQILEGLDSGDRLIVSGGQYLKSGDKLILPTSEEIATQ